MQYVVYKIQNLINHKIYIGSSQDVEKRWHQHKLNAFNPNKSCYNYPLYNSMRKYGLENFYFSIEKICSSKQEMENLEKQLIIKYNALDKKLGYNQTLYTECALRDPKLKEQILKSKSQKCALVNEKEQIIQIYPSYQEAARQNNLNNSANHIRLCCKGQQHSINNLLFFRDLDENNNVIHIDNNKTYKNKEKIIAIPIDDPQHPKYFESIYDAAIELDTDRSSIHKCIKGDTRYSTVKNHIIRKIDNNNNIIENNILIQDKINEYNEEHPLINGIRHTKTEWCQIYNMKWPTVRKRLKTFKINFEQALTLETKQLKNFEKR